MLSDTVNTSAASLTLPTLNTFRSVYNSHPVETISDDLSQVNKIFLFWRDSHPACFAHCPPAGKQLNTPANAPDALSQVESLAEFALCYQDMSERRYLENAEMDPRYGIFLGLLL